MLPIDQNTSPAPTPTGLPPMPGLPQPVTLSSAVDEEVMRTLGARMKDKFTQYATSRRMAELKWTQNARQFLGIYDTDVLIPKEKSKAYPKLTRVKVVSIVSRLMNLLFPTVEKNWTLRASKVPNLPASIMQAVLNAAFTHAQETGIPLTEDLIEGFVVREATRRALNLEDEIEDQLSEIGGSKQLDYVALCRKVIYSGVMYGCGVAKGPFVRSQTQSRWTQNPAVPGAFILSEVSVDRPQYEFIRLWDYYPDMSAKTFASQEGQFIRHVMSRHQLRKLADDPAFMGDKIKEYLRDHTVGNYVRQTFETEIKAMGIHSNVNDQAGSKYEILEWNGYVSGKDLQAVGADVAEETLADDIEAVLWIIGDVLIRAEVNPWVELSPGEKVEMFHHFIFEEDETTLMGSGLPNIMRDSQMGVCTGTRMIIDNAAATCGPMLEINTQLMLPGQDITNISGFRNFYREGTGADAMAPAVRDITVENHVATLKSVVDMFLGFADTETFVGPATGGDMSKTPSEPLRSAAGASMFRGDAALPFKDILRNFDRFTQSLLNSIVSFNKQFNPREDIMGDAQVVPRGATSLMAKEMRGMTLDNLAQTLKPEEMAYLDKYEFIRERLAVRDVDLSALLVTREEADAIDARQSQAAQKQEADQAEMFKATLRELLAKTAKDLAQTDKNTAAADVARTNATLAIMEKGLNENEPKPTKK